MNSTIPLVLKLQADAMDISVPVASLLRNAKAIATKLGLDDALIWIDHELDGYVDVAVEDLPPYRNLNGEPKAFNPYHGWQPMIIDDAKLQKIISAAPISQALGTLEKMAHSKESGQFWFPYPAPAKSALMNAMHPPTDIHLELGSGAVFGILEAVRNLILSWALELEKAGILGDGLAFTVEEKVSAAPVSNQFFSQSIGVAQSVTGNAQVTNIHIASIDIEQVRDFLTQLQGSVTLLPEDTRRQLTPILTDVDAELATDQPDETKLRSLLKSVRSICEGAGGNIIAQGVVRTLETLNGV